MQSTPAAVEKSTVINGTEPFNEAEEKAYSECDVLDFCGTITPSIDGRLWIFRGDADRLGHKLYTAFSSGELYRALGVEVARDALTMPREKYPLRVRLKMEVIQ